MLKKVCIAILLSLSLKAQSYNEIPQGAVHAYTIGNKVSLVIEGASAAVIYKSLSSIPQTLLQYRIQTKLGKKGKSVSCYILDDKKSVCYMSLDSRGIE
jgi:hypothetical protein